jgi:hypothetical protein
MRSVSDDAAPTGPPPLRPFGLVLHHDGRFTHEGAPIANRRLREHFERSVEYLADESKFIVRLRHFRGEVVVEEAGFFVRSIDLESGRIQLSDGSAEVLDLSSLRESAIDGALLCRVKGDHVPGGLLARFMHAAHAELLQAVEVEDDRLYVSLGGRRVEWPEIERETVPPASSD